MKVPKKCKKKIKIVGLMIANSPFCKTKFRRDLLNSKP